MENVDFYLSKDGRLIIPTYNINYLVSISESTLPSMPEATETTVSIAGRDGDEVLSTTYSALNFTLTCYTNDNLTQKEKREEEIKINQFLNSIKDTTLKFGIQKDEKFYKVKYSGSLSTTNYPKFLSFSIPLKSSNPFAYSIESKSLKGNSSETSETIKKVGAVFTINGVATNPIISLNDYSMEYNTNILENEKIIIDTNKSTVTHINSDGIKANAMKYYNHQFPKIESGTNTLKILSGITDETQVTVEWNDLML